MESTKTCLICNRIKKIKQGTNSFFVKELETGYVVIGDYQFFKGYTLFLYKNHIEELHQLPEKEKLLFLKEMAMVAEAVYKTVNPEKLNYELLGNTDKHMHWHLIPRYNNDPNPQEPIWVIDKNIRKAETTKPSEKELEKLKQRLKKKLENK